MLSSLVWIPTSQFVNPYIYNIIWLSATNVKNHDMFKREENIYCNLCIGFSPGKHFIDAYKQIMIFSPNMFSLTIFS